MLTVQFAIQDSADVDIDGDGNHRGISVLSRTLKRRLIETAGSALIAAAIAFPGAAVADGSLNVVTGDNYPPYVDWSLPDGGWVTKVIAESLEDAGFRFEDFEVMPWKRGLEETRAGNTDGTFPWGYTEERAVDMLYSEPIFWNTAYAWVGPDSTISIDSLRGKKFCLPLGYVEFGRTRELAEQDPTARSSVPNMTQCFGMLRAGRVDFVVSTANDAEAAIAEAGLDPSYFRALEPEMHRITYHFLVGKNRPLASEIIEAVNRGLAKHSAEAQEEQGNIN